MPRFPDPKRTAARLRQMTSLRPTLAIVLGSAFGDALDEVKIDSQIPYSRLSGFPASTVPGHRGRLIVGHLGDAPLMILQGRGHYYEGHSMLSVTFPVRVLAELGITALLLTNAAGGINRKFRVGDFMCVTDHLNFMGINPLRGIPVGAGTRFVDLTNSYDRSLIGLLKKAALQCKARLHSGVYLAVSGPSYETPAEITAFARLGADAIGMSTVPETIVARQCGLAVAALSLITNRAAGLSGKDLSHDDVLAAATNVGRKTGEFLKHFTQMCFDHDSEP